MDFNLLTVSDANEALPPLAVPALQTGLERAAWPENNHCPRPKSINGSGRVTRLMRPTSGKNGLDPANICKLRTLVFMSHFSQTGHWLGEHEKHICPGPGEPE